MNATPRTARPAKPADGEHAASAGSGPAMPDRRWLALAVVAVAQLMTALDATVVNIALPSAQRALSFDDGHRAWVITAYTLAFAGLLLLGGRISDHLGARRALQLGLTGFAVSSAVAGAAPTFSVLVAGRAMQGAFAALLAPTVLSMIVTTFTDPRERARAFAVFGAVASTGAVVGLLLGGTLTEFLDWRWCLYVNVLIAGGALAAGRAVLPPARPMGRMPVDVASAALATAGLTGIVLGCSQAARHGWGSATVTMPLALGALALALFLIRQARIQVPLLPLHILADRARGGAYLAVAAGVLGSFGMFLVLTYYFQVVLHWSPLRSGIAFLPLSIAVSGGAYVVASRLLPRVAPRSLVVAGLVVAASGLALLAGLDSSSGYFSRVMPAEVLLGIGMGGIFTPAITVATSGVDRRDAGVASAVANTAMQVGSSVGTAVLNTIAVTATSAYLANREGAPEAAALVHGYGTATGAAAVLLVLVAIVCAALMRIRAPEQREDRGRFTGGKASGKVAS